MKPINFFSPAPSQSPKKQEILVSIIMLLIILIIEGRSIYTMYLLATRSFDETTSNTIEKQQQAIAASKERYKQLQEQITLLSTILDSWCQLPTALANIIEVAHENFTIQHLFIDKQRLKIIGTIEQDKITLLSKLISSFTLYTNLGFTTAPIDTTNNYTFTITTREAVDELSRATYANQNSVALANSSHDKNKTTSIT